MLLYDRYVYLAARSTNESTALRFQFETLLTSLTDNHNYDHFRLPLQVSLILTPICLLQEALIHKSSYYSQRYKLMMVNKYPLHVVLGSAFRYQYGKGVGNGRPKSIVQLETIIWKALFDIACGVIEVHDAAQTIANAIPDILTEMDEKDSSWFRLGTLNIPSVLQSLSIDLSR